MEARVERVEHELHLPTIKVQTILSLVVLALAIHILLPQVGELRHSVRPMLFSTSHQASAKNR